MTYKTIKANSQTRIIRKLMGMNAWNSRRSQLPWQWVVDAQSMLPLEYRQIVQGIAYGYHTSRVTAVAGIAIRDMNCWQFTSLVGLVSAHAKTQGEACSWVNEYLTNQYKEQAS